MRDQMHRDAGVRRFMLLSMELALVKRPAGTRTCFSKTGCNAVGRAAFRNRCTGGSSHRAGYEVTADGWKLNRRSSSFVVHLAWQRLSDAQPGSS